MLFRGILVHPENDIKPINTQFWQNAGLLNVKAGGMCIYIYHYAES
jgi:hypothetical protein